MSPKMREAVAEARRLEAAGVRPSLFAIAKHYKVCYKRLVTAYGPRGHIGRLSAQEVAEHLAAAPHICITSPDGSLRGDRLQDVTDCLASGWSLEDTADELELEIEQVEALARVVEVVEARAGRHEQARRITAMREELAR